MKLFESIKNKIIGMLIILALALVITLTISLMEFNNEVQSKQELMQNVTTTMDEINSSSKKIDDIVCVINDISFQTNLLALNAALVEELTGTSKSMRSNAIDLSGLVAKFRINDSDPEIESLSYTEKRNKSQKNTKEKERENFYSSSNI